jgi:ADP-heptose:LPS heptosyltransferase
VFQIGSLGDTVLSVPALQALRDRVGPTSTITLLHDDGAAGRVAPPAVIPDGLVDDSLRFAGPRRPPPGSDRAPRLVLGTRRLVGGARRAVGAIGLLRRIRRRRFDAVVNLALADRSARSLRRDRAFFRLAGITTIVGFDGEVPGGPEAQVRLERLAPLGASTELGPGPWFRPGAHDQADADRWRADAGLTDRRIVTIAPGTLMDAKRWPVDRWGELGRRLRAELDLEPVVVGGPADHDDGDDLVAAWGGGANAAGALTPGASAALMAGAALHIGVDTGTTHLASAAGTAVVALYSHRAPIRQWAPMGPEHWIVDHPVPCAGCLAVDCPVAGHPCMTGIELADVWSQVLVAHQGVLSR